MSVLPDCVVNNSLTIDLKFLEISTDGKKSFLVKDKKWEATICNIPWKIAVENSDAKDGLQMLLTCDASSTENWKLQVSRLLVKFESCSLKTVGQFEFSSTANTAEVFLSQDDIKSFYHKRYSNSSLLMTVSITLMWTKQVGLSHVFPIAYEFHNRTANSSLVIEISGERFFVNLEYLSQLSHYFAELNLEALPMDEETNLRLLSLDDVDSWAFEELLKVLYPSKRMTNVVDHINFEVVANLADGFKCPTVMNKCAKAVVTMVEISPAKLLLFCDKYNMYNSMEELLAISGKDRIRTVVDSPEFDSLSKSAMMLIVLRLAEN